MRAVTSQFPKRIGNARETAVAVFKQYVYPNPIRERDWSGSNAFCDDVHQRQRQKSAGGILFLNLVLLQSRQIFLAYKGGR